VLDSEPCATSPGQVKSSALAMSSESSVAAVSTPPIFDDA